MTTALEIVVEELARDLRVDEAALRLALARLEARGWKLCPQRMQTGMIGHYGFPEGYAEMVWDDAWAAAPRVLA